MGGIGSGNSPVVWHWTLGFFTLAWQPPYRLSHHPSPPLTSFTPVFTYKIINTNFKTSKIILTMTTALVLFVTAPFPSLFSFVWCSSYAGHSYREKTVSQDAIATLTEACVWSAGICGEAQPLGPSMSYSLSSLSAQFGEWRNIKAKSDINYAAEEANYKEGRTTWPHTAAPSCRQWACQAGPAQQVLDVDWFRLHWGTSRMLEYNIITAALFGGNLTIQHSQALKTA